MSRTIIAAVDDMLFASKIRATAEHLNVEVRFARSVDSLLNAVREGEAALIVVDLHSQRIDPIALATLIKADEKLHSIPLLGFFSHVHAELQRDGDGYRLDVRATKLARAAWIDFGALDAELSDNALSLLPGETVSLRLQSNASLAELQRQLTLRSLTSRPNR